MSNDEEAHGNLYLFNHKIQTAKNSRDSEKNPDTIMSKWNERREDIEIEH